MKLDIGIAGIAKDREEVTGDTVEVLNGKDSTTIVFSDGLGSGIKASILSILTVKIAAGLLRRNIDLEQVFATIADTLPTCKVRNLAYATLTILKINTNGDAHLIEYDNPGLMRIRQAEVIPLERKERVIAGKTVQEAFFQVGYGELLLLTSDGVINAGVGGIYKLGLGTDGLLDNLQSRSLLTTEVEVIAEKIADLAECCYLCKPGDDSTAIAIKTREERQAVILTGPPCDSKWDKAVVSRFLDQKDSQKIICGGATGNLVAGVTGRKLKASLQYEDPGVPPIATMEGIDLVTEGVLTLNKSLEQLEEHQIGRKLAAACDGATLLSNILLKADRIIFLAGTAFNPAHVEIMRSLHLKTRIEAVERIKEILTRLGKEVSLECY